MMFVLSFLLKHNTRRSPYTPTADDDAANRATDSSTEGRAAHQARRGRETYAIGCEASDVG